MHRILLLFCTLALAQRYIPTGHVDEIQISFTLDSTLRALVEEYGQTLTKKSGDVSVQLSWEDGKSVFHFLVDRHADYQLFVNGDDLGAHHSMMAFTRDLSSGTAFSIRIEELRDLCQKELFYLRVDQASETKTGDRTKYDWPDIGFSLEAWEGHCVRHNRVYSYLKTVLHGLSEHYKCTRIRVLSHGFEFERRSRSWICNEDNNCDACDCDRNPFDYECNQCDCDCTKCVNAHYSTVPEEDEYGLHIEFPIKTMAFPVLKSSPVCFM